MVRALKEEGFAVSVDSVDPQELLRGGQAGADYLLSLKEETLWVAAEVEATPVLIPGQPGDMNSLIRAMHAMLESGRRFFADPILDPIHFGFAESIVRFVEAYGLWHYRIWAEWFALLSGCLYLPWEIYKVAQKPTWIHWVVLAFNVVIVLYMLYVRLRYPRDLR